MRPLLLAISFLTRIPVRSGEASPKVMGASLAWFPFVGALVGLLPLCLAGLRPEHFREPAIGFACVAAWALVTGALHLDGVADFADALGGGRGERSRMLEIMRDPRIGAHGATALVLVLSGKLIAVIDLLATRALAWPLVLAPIVARFACVLAMRTFPYARKEGLGLLFHQNARWEHVAVAFIWLPLSVLALALLEPRHTSFPQDVTLASLVGLAAGLLVAWRAKRALGGLTGDVHGAIIELSELAFLLAAVFASDRAVP